MQMDPANAATLVIGALTIAASALTSHLTIAKAAARFEGASSARHDATAGELQRLRGEQGKQWESIHELSKEQGETKERVAAIEGGLRSRGLAKGVGQ
jgi:hypothetical protein